MSTIAIIQARTNSSRLPKKVLLDLCGKTVLERVIERVSDAKKIDQVIVTTTTKKEDNIITEICQKNNIKYSRGKEEDVLDQFYQAAKLYRASNIVRITADCPMIDPEIIDKTIDLYQKEKAGYAVNGIPNSFPEGINVEVFSFSALEKAWHNTHLKSEREHVTIYLWKNPDIFNKKSLINKVNLSDHRWVIDYPEDYQFVKKVFDKLYPQNPKFRMNDILNFLEANPEITKINYHIERDLGLAKSLKEDKTIEEL
ncbi:MAG: hypothetical protein COU27_01350 [Candidatus Levybacteria bacterium CG10_big_fil_rev_8_21_14_0_10_36_7]|nr:MAG: hypothetical protein COU27_01350 [Candidatus Levybacteria bacterium CG10_big_fil_rev_8_21_14_0_10_36_7]